MFSNGSESFRHELGSSEQLASKISNNHYLKKIQMDSFKSLALHRVHDDSFLYPQSATPSFNTNTNNNNSSLLHKTHTNSSSFPHSHNSGPLLSHELMYKNLLNQPSKYQLDASYQKSMLKHFLENTNYSNNLKEVYNSLLNTNSDMYGEMSFNGYNNNGGGGPRFDYQKLSNSIYIDTQFEKNHFGKRIYLFTLNPLPHNIIILLFKCLN